MARTLAVLLLLVAVTAAAESEAPATVTALVIVDIQEFYFPGGALPLVEPVPASETAGRVLARFRQNGDLVIHVQHESEQGMANHAAVAPLDDEIVIVKRQVNSFQDTELLEVLRTRDVNQLVIVGMQTHMCLEAAVRAAVDFGFATTVVADACATRDLKYGDTVVAAADVHASTLATLRAYAEVVDAETYLSR